MISASDIIYLFSGGPANTIPSKSLGGSPSSYEVSISINNLFDDFPIDKTTETTENYRCVYVYNKSSSETFKNAKIYLDGILDNPNQLQIGMRINNEIQKLNVSGGMPANGQINIKIGSETTGDISYSGTFSDFGSAIEQAINSIPSGNYKVKVLSSQTNSNQTFQINFLDPYGKRSQSPMQIISNTLKTLSGTSLTTQVSILSVGNPINAITPSISKDTTKPNTINFRSTSLNNTFSLGNLKPLDYFAVWIKRTITPESDASALSGATLKILGDIGSIIPPSPPSPPSPPVPPQNFGRLWGWGRNLNGVLGTNTSLLMTTSIIQTVAGGDTWQQLGSFKYSNTFGAVKNDMKLFMWGNNSYGQIGNESVVNISSPVAVATDKTWRNVFGNYGTTFALSNDYKIWAWGYNNYGQLAQQDLIHRSSPVQILSASSWYDLSFAGSFVTAIDFNNKIWGWGNNSMNVLGDSTISGFSSPIQIVSNDYNWQKVSNGSRFYMAIRSDGTLWGAGLNSQGQLGREDTVHRSSIVQVIGDLSKWKSISCGYRFVTGIKENGTLWTWGSNNTGQLGDGTTVNRSSPVQTTLGGDDWLEVSISDLFVAAIKKDGRVYTWGYGDVYGSLGNIPAYNKSQSNPVQVETFGRLWNKVEAIADNVFLIERP
jgi:alpha-tubulin suppressor-like RCC1 family protein